MNKKKQNNKKRGGVQSLSRILKKYKIEDKPRYVSKEFQDYGYRLALELGDVKNVGMYIKLAKITDRSVLERARNFVKDAVNVKSKARLFLWKMKQLKEGK